MNKFLRNIKLNIVSLAVPAAICVLICTFILTGITFSWFSSTVNAASSVIQSGEFKAVVTVERLSDTNTIAVSELETIPPADSYVIPDAEGNYNLAPGTYNVTLNFDGSVDGWVKICVQANEMTPVWKSVQLGPVNNGYIGTHTFKLTVEEEAVSALIKLDPTWNEPALETLGAVLNINPNTINSINAIGPLYEASTMAVEFAPTWSVDPISGFLYESLLGEYYNAATGEKVEPTTGYAYNEEGLLVHPVTLKTGTLIDGNLIDSETGLVIAPESGNLIDSFTGLEINPDGYLIDSVTGNLIDPETGFFIIADSEYQIVPATGYLYNKLMGTYHDPITYEEVISDVALGIIPPIEEVTTTEDLEYYDDSEITTEDSEIITEEVTDITDITEEITTITYTYVDGFAYIPDTVNYQLNPVPTVDPITGVETRILYSTVDQSLIYLNIFAYEYIDPFTGYYIIPGSLYQIIPSTGYLCYTAATDIAYMYINPMTGMFVDYNEAHGIIEDVTTEATDETEETTEATTEATEETTESTSEAAAESEATTTEVTTETTTEAVTTTTEATTTVTTTEAATTVTEPVTEPAVTTVPETDPSI